MKERCGRTTWLSSTHNIKEAAAQGDSKNLQTKQMYFCIHDGFCTWPRKQKYGISLDNFISLGLCQNTQPLHTKFNVLLVTAPKARTPFCSAVLLHTEKTAPISSSLQAENRWVVF